MMIGRAILGAAWLGLLPAAASAGEPPARPGHYVVFELATDGTPQPLFHAAVRLERADGSDAPVLATVGAPSGQVDDDSRLLRLQAFDRAGAKSAQVATLFLPGRIRGEFARDPDTGDGAIEAVDAPVERPAFVVRVPDQRGGGFELDIAGQRRRFDFDTLAASAPNLPLASYGTRSTLAPKAGASASPANRVDLLIIGDGYAAHEQDTFAIHADNLERSLLLYSPYQDYAGFLQFRRAFVASPQSGADHPPFRLNCSSDSCCGDSAAQTDPRAGQFVSTAFDARFCTAQSHRVLTINHAKVLAAAAAYPDWDVVFVTVNDPVYGGSGGSISVASAHTQAPKLVVHEFGHTFTDLADEYDTEYPGFGACSDKGLVPFRCEANVSDVNLFGQVKWRELPDTGIFEGARYQVRGMYRPVDNCVMRSLSAQFCPVCRQEFVLTLYRGGFGVPAAGISLIEPGSESPATTAAVRYVPGTGQVFRADLLQPTAETALGVRWLLDGVEVASGTPTFNFSQAEAVPATRQLELRVTDPAPLVHAAAAKPLLTQSRRWTIQVDSAPPVLVPDSGWYWNPAEGGRGYFFERRPGGSVFMAGFLYAADGRATWFTAQGTMADGETRFSAPMNTFRGGQTLSGSYRAPTATADLGTLTLSFSSSRNARLVMPGTDIPLERFPIASGSVVAPPQAGAPQSGWWWNADEGGRGYALEFQGDQVFLIAFMYDDAGEPVWYLANGSMAAPTRFAGRWLRFGGGQALGQPPRAPQVLQPDGGTLALEFSAADRGTLTLPDGRVIGIVRFPF